RDVAALLVDREQNVRTLGAQRVGEAAELVARRRVVREQAEAQSAAVDERSRPVGYVDAGEARQQARRGEARGRLAHPRTAPAVSPKAIRRCTSRKKTTTGTAVSVDAAISAPQSVWRLVPRKYDSHTVTVCFDWSFSRTRAKMYSFQVVMNANTDVATSPGPISGSRIFTNTPSRVEPSTIAASSRSLEMPIRKPRSVQTQNGSTNVM